MGELFSMKIIKILVLLLFLVILTIYIIPNPHKSIEELYLDVDKGVVSSLLEFRNQPLSTIEVNGTEWKYLVTGQGSDTILFLHGMGGSYDIWWQQINSLKDRYTIIAMTYPAKNSLADLSQGILEILNKENIDKTNIIGSSLGGYLAQYLVSEHPEKVNKAIFANTFPPNDLILEKNKTLGSLLPFLPEWLIMNSYRDSIINSVYPASHNSELVKAFLLELSYGGMTKEQFIGRYRSVVDPFEAVNPNNLGIPVMIIESSNDPLVEEELRNMLKETYPSAAVFTFNSGHFPYLNEPRQYIEIINDFFAE